MLQKSANQTEETRIRFNPVSSLFPRYRQISRLHKTTSLRLQLGTSRQMAEAEIERI